MNSLIPDKYTSPMPYGARLFEKRCEAEEIQEALNQEREVNPFFLLFSKVVVSYFCFIFDCIDFQTENGSPQTAQSVSRVQAI